MSSSDRSRTRRKRKTGRLIFLLFLTVLLIAVPLEFYLSNNVIHSQKPVLHIARMPESFDGLKILHLSDLHEKTFGKDNKDLLRLAERAAPDIIAVTGDLYQSENGVEYTRTLFSDLTAIAPVYYVTGNHEWNAEWVALRSGQPSVKERVDAVMDELGVTRLDSDFVLLEKDGQKMVLAGLCDRNGPAGVLTAAGLYTRIMEEYGSVFTVLLSHRYELLEDYSAAGYDIVLAGHSHGGVVRLPFTDGLIGPGGREFFPEHTAGVYIQGETTMFVSRGMGDTDFPRFLNRPDMPLLTLSCRQ